MWNDDADAIGLASCQSVVQRGKKIGTHTKSNAKGPALYPQDWMSMSVRTLQTKTKKSVTNSSFSCESQTKALFDLIHVVLFPLPYSKCYSLNKDQIIKICCKFGLSVSGMFSSALYLILNET